MPGLPSKQARRKGPTPRRLIQKDDAWRVILAIMGLEPLAAEVELHPEASSSSPAAMETEAAEAMAAPTAAASASASAASAKKMTILDLPSETQKDIFKHSTSTDLISLSLVSKHFRDIAAEQLYRSFHIVFPDEDDPSNDSPIDGLAGGLDTFVTSEYDYAKYLREIVLETLSGGDKGERAYRHYLYDVSCGKFMNTLLLLTLRKAKALETFRWDIRVELSRQVFKALHSIQALQHLHLRMQVGHSIYQTPPDLAAPIPIIIELGLPTPPAHHNAPMLLPLPPNPVGTNLFSFGPPPSATMHKKKRRATDAAPSKLPPPTISGFKNLKTLSILDMDTLDYVHELKTCIENCSSTLSTLKLSFSEALANKSRKPPPEVQSDDDSDQEDEFGQIVVPTGPPPPMGGASDPNGPSKAFKAQEEKKKQEAVLGKIFAMEFPVSKPKPPPPPPKEEVVKEQKVEEDPKRRFIRNLAPVAAKLMAHIKPGSELTDEAKETLSMIEKAAKMYIDSQGKGKEKEAGEASGSSTAKATPASSSAGMDDAAEEDPVMSGAASGPGLFDNDSNKKKKAPTSTETGVSDPEEINIEEPEGELTIEFGAPETTSEEVAESGEPKVAQAESSNTPIDAMSWANKLHVLEHHMAIKNSHEEIEKEGEILKKRMEEFKLKLQSGKISDADYKMVAEAEAEFKKVAKRVEELSRNMQEVNDQIDDLKETSKQFNPATNAKMREYVRNTRGLTLNTLAIYLIPLKASVLSRAIDVNVLQSITLLNVGPQMPFWNILARENKNHPLPLRKIYTDNVTLPFLTLVGQLDIVTELLLLERTAKTRVEPTAAKTTVQIEQIRKIALKKHAHTLKVLMIRNDSSMEWDLNVKSAILLCQRSKQLEELAASFGFRTMHTLMQFLPGLTAIRALHTIQLRTDDQCHNLTTQFRKFTIDIVANNPAIKLEYMALDTCVERLCVRKSTPKPSKSQDKKGKGKAGGGMDNTSKALAELIIGLGSSTWSDSSASNGSVSPSVPDWQDSSDDEEWGSSSILGPTGLKVETVEGIRFCDIIGVRIFEKDVLTGRL